MWAAARAVYSRLRSAVTGADGGYALWKTRASTSELSSTAFEEGIEDDGHASQARHRVPVFAWPLLVAAVSGFHNPT